MLTVIFTIFAWIVWGPVSAVTLPSSNVVDVRYWPSRDPLLVSEAIAEQIHLEFSTTTWHGLRNVVSLLTAVTQYKDTAITNYHNTTTLINTTYVTSFDVASNPIPATDVNVYQTLAKQTLEGNRTVTAGITVQSPQAFYVFSTVKVIHVPAVTDSNGNLRCATTSTDRLCCGKEGGRASCPTGDLGQLESLKLARTRIFDGINTHAEDYFHSRSLPGAASKSGSNTLQATAVATWPETTVHYNHSVISFSVPFVYLPLRGATEKEHVGGTDVGLTGPGKLDDGDDENVESRHLLKRAVTPQVTLTNNFDGATEDFGYVPQALIDWMVEDPTYMAGYPELASCLPGGPPIKVPSDNGVCGLQWSPVYQKPVLALTVNSVFTIQGDGCFHARACPTIQDFSQGAEMQPTPAEAPAQVTAQAVQSGASTEKTEAGTPRTTSTISTSGSALLLTVHSDLVPLPKDKASTHLESDTDADAVINDQISTPVTQPKGQPQRQELAQQPTIIIDSSTLTTNSDSHFDIGSQTLILGSSSVRVGDSYYSIPLRASAVVINGSPSPPSPLPHVSEGSSNEPEDQPSKNEKVTSPDDQARAGSQPDMAALIMNGFGPGATPDLAPSGTALTPGESPITVSDYVPKSEVAVAVNGVISPMQFATENPKEIPGELQTSENEKQLSRMSKTALSPGTPAVDLFRTKSSLPSTDTPVTIEGSTSSLLILTDDRSENPSTFTGYAHERPTISGQILTPGASAVIISGTTYSQPGSGSKIMINGSPSPWSPPTPAAAQPALLIASETLLPGSVFMYSGTPISFPASGTDKIVVGSQTQSFIQATSMDEAAGNRITFTIGGANATATLGEFVPSITASKSIVGNEDSETGRGIEDGNGSIGNSGEDTGDGSRNGTQYAGPGFESKAVERGRTGVYIRGIGVVLSLVVGL
ncbi:MAG: hypothetical protein LQ348_001460 [Seirophora lacunosa]|nr:MAG: hypothetical protein LQ348_001460 [Seirophora lacunosa]